MTIKFELNEQQHKRLNAWFKHHWEVVHKGFHPRGDSPVVCEYIFGPTGVGDNVRVECSWCPKGHQGHEVDLTEDDGGELIIQYDDNWNRLPAPWEKK